MCFVADEETTLGRLFICSLYTDLSNPTSNSIYTKIGYVPIGDALELDFLSSE